VERRRGVGREKSSSLLPERHHTRQRETSLGEGGFFKNKMGASLSSKKREKLFQRNIGNLMISYFFISGN